MSDESRNAEEIKMLVREVSAVAAKLGADHAALLKVVQLIAVQCGLKHIDGVPLHTFYDAQRVKFLEKMLIQVEDTDPPLAAALQQIVDEWKKPPPPPI
jgi:hypothetical protein